MIEGQHFQNAYVCDDIGAAIEMFTERGHVRPIRPFDVDSPVRDGNGRCVRQKLKVCFIWTETVQYELIQVIDDPLGIYANCLSNGGPLRFHHTCMRIDNWASFRARVDRQNFPIAMQRDGNEDNLTILYLDARKMFGHYLEYTWMTDEMWETIRQT